ncbi:MAG: penicillin-binding protein 2 [Candidatus Woykebacteria bacterium]
MKKNSFLGPLFGENFQKNKSKRRAASHEMLKRAESWIGKGFLDEDLDISKTKISGSRRLFFYLAFILAFVILFSRSFELQVIEGDSFLGRAEDNRYKVTTNHAPRGVIYDRNGQVLARNVPTFRVSLDEGLITDEKREDAINKLSKIIGVSGSSIKDKLKEKGSGSSDPITIKEDASHEEALRLQSSAIPGVEVEIRPKREYPYKEILAHVIGYTSEVSKEELKNPTSTYQLGDRVGRAGVEQEFENILRGANGYDLAKVDAAGKKLGSLLTTKPVAGGDITISIDIELQKKVYVITKKWLKKAGSKAGSAVAIDPKTGEILALVSIPAFDNNSFEAGLTQKEYDRLLKNTTKPLLSRVIGAAYPPGSTFKLVTAAAGLEKGAITKDTEIVDTGFIKLGNQVFNNWLWLDHHRREGAINVVRALSRSNDTFFFKLGQKIGEDAIVEMAKKFSLGEATGVNLPGEALGLVPSSEWKLKTKGEIWFPGETLNLAIGQGDLLVSPIQLSRIAAFYANGGSLVKPTILKGEETVLIPKFLNDETVEVVREGMYQNTVGDGNVSYLFNSFKVKSAGKTGTAESGDSRPHAWYTGFAPYEDPEIVVTVMGEHAGHGSEVSAPATKEIFEWWFGRRP